MSTEQITFADAASSADLTSSRPQAESWPDSEGLCEAWGTLANVHSNDTNALLSSLLTAAGRERAWVGLTNIGHAGWFEWTGTHAAPDFTAWSVGAPAGVACSGVQLGAGATWTDRWMFDQADYICQAPADSSSWRRVRPAGASRLDGNVFC